MGIREKSYGVRDRMFPFAAKAEPKHVSYLSVIATLPVLVFREPVIQLGFILLALVLDSYDGFLARKSGKENSEGHMTDLACDRFSELIIFIFNPLGMALVLANVFLSIQNIKKGWWVIPLRQVYVLYLGAVILLPFLNF